MKAIYQLDNAKVMKASVQSEASVMKEYTEFVEDETIRSSSQEGSYHSRCQVWKEECDHFYSILQPSSKSLEGSGARGGR